MLRRSSWFLVVLLGLSPLSRAQDPVDFARDVQPILAARCYVCHGTRQQKGDLRLDLRASVLELPAERRVLVVGRSAESEIYRRVTLTKDDPDVMPSKGRLLTPEEQQILARWIDQGATWPQAADPKSDAPADPLVDPALDEEMKRRSASAVATLKTRGWVAGRVAADTEAVDVNGSLLGPAIVDADLAGLSGLEPTLVWLNLARTSVSDGAIATLTRFPRLRRLNLSNTGLGDAAMKSLGSLTELESLNLYGTKVSDAGLEYLSTLTKLRKLYLWQTAVTSAGAEAIRAKLPTLDVNLGGALVPIAFPAAAKPVNAVCPVTDKPVDSAQTTEFEGRLVAFCCADCKARFLADPKAFAEKLPTPPRTPVNEVCPLTGKAVAADQTVEHEGRLVAFCCANCKARFAADPKAFTDALAKVSKKP